MKQGDVFWHTFDPPNKRRPVLILTRTSSVQVLTGITVASITTKIRGTRSEVKLSKSDGLFADCVVNLHNIHTVEKSLLRDFISHLSRKKMKDVRTAIEFALGFDNI